MRTSDPLVWIAFSFLLIASTIGVADEPAFELPDPAALGGAAASAPAASKPIPEPTSEPNPSSPNPSLPGASAVAGPKPVVTWTDDEVEVIVASDASGKIVLRDVLRALNDATSGGTGPNGSAGNAAGNAAGNDPSAAKLERLLPDAAVDLNAFTTQALIAAANFGLRESGQLSVQRLPDGTSRVCLRCDLAFLNRQRPAFDPTFDLDPPRESERPIGGGRSTTVVFLHGFHGKSESFDGIREYFRQAGFRTACVHYDDHVAVAESAQKIAGIVQTAMTAQSPAELVLVGHSMGGLVAREWTENPKLATPAIKRLITVGSPHGGSAWADITPLPDLLVSGRVTAKSVVGLFSNRSETPSAEDLRPESEFLKRLNARPRAASVRYTTIIGTRSPVNERDVAWIRASLEARQQRQASAPLAARVKAGLENFDEIVDGKGDGAVAVDRAKIEGVDDVVLVPLTHWDLFARSINGEVNPVWKAILDRVSLND